MYIIETLIFPIFSKKKLKNNSNRFVGKIMFADDIWLS